MKVSGGTRRTVILLIGGLVSATLAAPAAWAAPKPGPAGPRIGRAVAVWTPTGITAGGRQVVAPNTAHCDTGPMTGDGTVYGCPGISWWFDPDPWIKVQHVYITGNNKDATAVADLASVWYWGLGYIGGPYAYSQSYGSCGYRMVTSVAFAGYVPIPPTGAPNQVVTVPGVGTVTFNYQHHDPVTNTARAAAVKADLAGPNATGTVFIAYAESGMQECST